MNVQPRAQLSELLTEYGFASRDLAQVLGITLPLFRAYKNGTQELPDITIGQLDKFYHMVTRLYYVNINTTGPKHYDGQSWSKTIVTSWMDKPFDLEEGYTITPWDIFKNNDLNTAEKFFSLILVLQFTHQSFEHVLDDALPGWRDTRSDWEVFLDTDGHNSIRLRS